MEDKAVINVLQEEKVHKEKKFVKHR